MSSYLLGINRTDFLGLCTLPHLVSFSRSFELLGLGLSFCSRAAFIKTDTLDSLRAFTRLQIRLVELEKSPRAGVEYHSSLG